MLTARTKEKFELIRFNVERFKVVNELFGNHTGDAALRYVSDCLRKEFAHMGKAARFGGDELAVLVPAPADPDAVLQAVENVLARVSEWNNGENMPMTLSCSAGIAVLQDGVTTYEQLYRNADAALYRAQNEGKNRCRIYKSNPEMPMQGV